MIVRTRSLNKAIRKVVEEAGSFWRELFDLNERKTPRSRSSSVVRAGLYSEELKTTSAQRGDTQKPAPKKKKSGQR
jgi:hypothetical protein